VDPACAVVPGSVAGCEWEDGGVCVTGVCALGALPGEPADGAGLAPAWEPQGAGSPADPAAVPSLVAEVAVLPPVPSGVSADGGAVGAAASCGVVVPGVDACSTPLVGAPVGQGGKPVWAGAVGTGGVVAEELGGWVGVFGGAGLGDAALEDQVVMGAAGALEVVVGSAVAGAPGVGAAGVGSAVAGAPGAEAAGVGAAGVGAAGVGVAGVASAVALAAGALTVVEGAAEAPATVVEVSALATVG
jgi:hypothetical protein